MSREIMIMQDYGKVSVSIKEYMAAKNLSRNALAKATNTRFEVIDRWYKGDMEKIDADVLARICYVLECDPGDIIRYTVIDVDNR